MSIPLNWANKELQIPEPKDNEPVLTRPQGNAETTPSTALKGVLNGALTVLKQGAREPAAQQSLDLPAQWLELSLPGPNPE